MERDTPNSEGDIRPWAAYVLGRNPRTLQIWHRRHWAAVEAERLGCGRRFRVRIDRELADIDRALRTLVDSDRIGAAILDRFREEKEAFTLLHRDLIHAQEDPFYEGKFFQLRPDDPPGRPILSDAALMSSGLLRREDEYRPFWELGNRLGFKMDLLSEENHGYPTDREGCMNLAEELEAIMDEDDNPARGDLLDQARAICRSLVFPCSLPERDRSVILRRRLSHLDHEIRDALIRYRNQSYVLVLDKHEMYFHGKRFLYASHRLVWFEILWVLAEYVVYEKGVGNKGWHGVSRKVISEKAKSLPEESALPILFHRLKENIIAPATREYFAKKQLHVPADIGKTWYIGPPKNLNRKSVVGGPHTISISIAIRSRSGARDLISRRVSLSDQWPDSAVWSLGCERP
jgi:hypothetical protein